MKAYLIVFVVGRDRPGIVDDVSSILFEKGANIEDSRMATLGGEFGMMILVSCDPASTEEVKNSLDRLRDLGFQTMVRETMDPKAVPRQAEMPIRFEIRSMDHPGVVRKVVRVLRKFNINIDSLETRVTTAPLSGTPLFDLELEGGVPRDKSISEVKLSLAELAAEENLDLTFKK